MLSINNNAALRNLSALVDFSNLINSNLELEYTLNNLLLTCLGKFQTSRAIVVLFNQDNKLEIKAYKGFNSSIHKIFPSVDVEGLDSNADLKRFFDESGIAHFQEIDSSGKIIGYLLLGKRLVGTDYDQDDKDFLKTLLNIAASAIDNSIIVEKLKSVNRDLDAKVNQLSSLFDLSKEFSGILDINRVGKVLVYSIIGQMLVTKFAVLTCSNGIFEIIENRFPEEQLVGILKSCSKENFNEPIFGSRLKSEFPDLNKLGIEMIVPMQIKSETKGLILLGRKTTGLAYSKSDREYISSVGSLAIISIENGRLFSDALEKQRLEKDLEIAQNIQRNLLPSKFPKLRNFEIVAVNQSAKQVGGDYYDVIKLDKDRTLIAIADVSGKGVQAALLMANLQAFIQIISKQNISLHEASNIINDLVSENTTDGSFITFFWGILDDNTKEFTYVNMGHNPPLHIRNAEISKMKMGGMILGVMPTIIPYKFETISMKQGDAVILFTDGITEAMSKDGEEYSDERLESLAASIQNCTAKSILEEILADVKNFAKGVAQSDDITAMVIKVN